MSVGWSRSYEQEKVLIFASLSNQCVQLKVLLVACFYIFAGICSPLGEGARMPIWSPVIEVSQTFNEFKGRPGSNSFPGSCQDDNLIYANNSVLHKSISSAFIQDILVGQSAGRAAKATRNVSAGIDVLWLRNVWLTIRTPCTMPIP